MVLVLILLSKTPSSSLSLAFESHVVVICSSEERFLHFPNSLVGGIGSRSENGEIRETKAGGERTCLDPTENSKSSLVIESQYYVERGPRQDSSAQLPFSLAKDFETTQ